MGLKEVKSLEIWELGSFPVSFYSFHLPLGSCVLCHQEAVSSAIGSHQLFIAAQLGVRAHKPHTSHDDMLIGLILCRFCTGKAATVRLSTEASHFPPVLLDIWPLQPYSFFHEVP